MNTATINKKEAEKLYKAADDAQKKIMQQLMPDWFGEVWQKIKTYEDACAATIRVVSSVPNENDTKDEAAYKKVKIITAAINGDWVPDYSDSNQPKFEIIWVKDAAGSGFSLSGVAHGYASTYVSSRLVFKTRERAEYAAKQFRSEFNDFLTA